MKNQVIINNIQQHPNNIPARCGFTTSSAPYVVGAGCCNNSDGADSHRLVTPENITDLAPNEVFVFGSNLRGIHGAGAARLAHEQFGAVWRVWSGSTGRCYAIPTKDQNIETMPLDAIQPYIAEFLDLAHGCPQKRFLVTAIGCGLAGYTAADIAPLFRCAPIPPNVALPASFWEVLHRSQPCEAPIIISDSTSQSCGSSQV